MSIEFKVEDGTGYDDSTSYTTVAEFLQYWENRGVDYSALSSAQVQALLNSATAYVDISFRFYGAVTGEDQALEFPRQGVIDKRGYEIANSTIPTELKNAVCEYAGYIYVNGQITEIAQGVKSKSIGPVSVTYTDNAANAGKIRIPLAEKWLKGLIDPRVKVLRQ